MSYEVRMVPPDWQHPEIQEIDPDTLKLVMIPMALYDQDFQSACLDWMAEAHLFMQGNHPIQKEDSVYAEAISLPDGRPDLYKFATEINEMPDPTHYRERVWTVEEATACQVYDLLTEGRPISPVFVYRDDALVWLVNEQHRTIENALALINNEFPIPWKDKSLETRYAEGILY